MRKKLVLVALIGLIATAGCVSNTDKTQSDTPDFGPKELTNKNVQKHYETLKELDSFQVRTQAIMSSGSHDRVNMSRTYAYDNGQRYKKMVRRGPLGSIIVRYQNESGIYAMMKRGNQTMYRVGEAPLNKSDPKPIKFEEQQREAFRFNSSNYTTEKTGYSTYKGKQVAVYDLKPTKSLEKLVPKEQRGNVSIKQINGTVYLTKDGIIAFYKFEAHYVKNGKSLRLSYKTAVTQFNNTKVELPPEWVSKAINSSQSRGQ